MYEILEQEDGIWLHRAKDTPRLIWLGPRDEREAIEDAMAHFLEGALVD